MENFWPQLQLSDVASPFDVIKTQGEFLEQHTNGILSYIIENKTFEHKNWPTGRAIRHEFYVRAPLFDDFKFMLFYIVHDFIAIYPVTIGLSKETETSKTCRDKEELEVNLKEILNKPETITILQSMLIQSKQR